MHSVEIEREKTEYSKVLWLKIQKIGAFRSKTQRPKSKNRTCYSIDLRISSENEQQVDIPQRKTPEERREEKTAIITTATTIEMVFIWLNTIKWA